MLVTANWLLILCFLDPATEAAGARPGGRRLPSHLGCAWAAALLCAAFAVVHYVYRFTVGFQVM